MNFHLPKPFWRPDPSLVDRVCEQATTIAVLAEVAHQQSAHIETLRRAAQAYRREPRKDKASIVAAKASMTARLKAEMGQG